MTHICVNKITITSSVNGLSPSRHHAIIWTNAGTLETNFNEILSVIHTFWCKKMYLKMASAKLRQICPGASLWFNNNKATCMLHSTIYKILSSHSIDQCGCKWLIAYICQIICNHRDAAERWLAIRRAPTLCDIIRYKQILTLKIN